MGAVIIVFDNFHINVKQKYCIDITFLSSPFKKFRMTALVQVWNLEYLAKTREQECHDKGVKCMDLNHSVILTGSYDATFKVGRLMLPKTCLLCCALLCIVVHCCACLHCSCQNN